MKHRLAALYVGGALLLGSVQSYAGPLTQIAPLPGVNSDLNTDYTNGSNYPQGGNLSVGGITFTLTTGTGPTGATDTFVIQDPTFPGLGGSNPTVFDIPVGVLGVTTVYTLMNSAFGTDGENIASLEFFGSGGATSSGSLIEGVNIRDHYNDGFVNTLSDPTVKTILFSGDVRLDMQTWNLPALFATQTLDFIRFTTNGDSRAGEAFLAGVTVETAAATPADLPEPSTMMVFLTGLLGLGALFYRQRKIA